MKTLFFDHDGVICLGSEFGSRFKKRKKDNISVMLTNLGEDETSINVNYRFDNFNKKAVKILNEIIKETDAEIVVSSDWRKFATLEELGEFYELQGVIKKPIGFTRELKDFNKDTDALFSWKGWYERIRILEIENWLENNKVESWVAVDDMMLGELIRADELVSHGLKNFVHTPRLYEGIKQTGIKEKIINFLNNSDDRKID